MIRSNAPRVRLDVRTPSWLHEIPSLLITPDGRDTMTRPQRGRELLQWLESTGGSRRPTLWQLECERARRGIGGRRA